jgi:hypothetical protein
MQLDQFKHPRTLGVPNMKHHFWWIANFVWSFLLPTYDGDIFWMEDDHVVTSDVLELIPKMRKIVADRNLNVAGLIL